MTDYLEGAVKMVRGVLAEARDRNPWLRLMAVENEIDTILDALASITRERDEARKALKTPESRALYWRNAYELLVAQTGRDLNDGFGIDPRKADHFRRAALVNGEGGE